MKYAFSMANGLLKSEDKRLFVQCHKVHRNVFACLPGNFDKYS